MSDTWDSAPLATPKAAMPGSWDSAPLAGPSTQQKAVVSATDNGEEATRALAISKKTAIPATVVQSDLPGYDAHARQQSAKAAAADPYLSKYIDGNPMAPKVSGDDYEQLGVVGKAIQAISPKEVTAASHRQVVNSIPELNEALATAPGREKLLNAAMGLPSTLLEDVVSTTREGVQGSLSSIMAPATRARAGDKGDSFWGGFVNQFKDLGSVGSGAVGLAFSPFLPVVGVAKTAVARPLAIITGLPLEGVTSDVGTALMGLGVRGKPTMAPTANLDSFLSELRGKQTRAEIDEFLRKKAEGDNPPGAMLQIEHAKVAEEGLTKAVEVAQESKTKTRSPELFEEAVAAHGDGEVHISGEKIVELYQKAGKVPAEGDGLFGFVPDIGARAADAAATGGEVTIPVSKYIAHVDPTVHEGLKESVRLHEAPTTEEAKVIKEEADKFIEAFHGTPHDFESFDLSKIGTGEGAQVYGHGLYFAENKAVAEGYKQAVSNKDFINKARELYDEFESPDEAVRLMKEDAELSPQQKRLVEALEKDEWLGFDYPHQAIAAALSKGAEKKWEMSPETIQAIRETGQLYKVSINADPAHFLDWGAPIGPREITVAEKLGMKIPNDGELYTGQDFYNDVAAHIGSNGPGFTPDFKITREQASKALADAGIPGIKYLDQGSRGKADGTRNFVVFDDRLVKIKEKNGEPVAAMLEAAVEASQAMMSLGKTDPFLNLLFTKGEALGITENEINKYSSKIANQEQAILDKAVAVGKREAGKRLTPEWKRNEAKVRDEVTTELRESGAFAAEKYLRENKIVLGGDNIDLIADQLAPLFGFQTGDEMRRALTALETEQAASGKSSQRQLPDAIKAETAKRMEERYGNLAENIAKEAREIALADHTFDVLADEVRLLARASGGTSPLGRNEMVSWAKQSFERSNIVEAGNWEKHRRAVEKNGREAEKALLKGDFAEAFMWKQRQFLAATVARQSAELQGLIDRAEKKIDRFQSEEQIDGLAQAYLEQIRQVLASVGLPQHFAPLADTGALRDFVMDSEGQIAAAPWLMDGSQPKLKDMSVQQFREFVDTLKSMEHVGRQAEKIFTAHGEATLQNAVFDLDKAMERFKPVEGQGYNQTLTQRAKSFGRKIIGAHLLVERMFDYTDKFDPEGPFTRYIDRPLREANRKELELTEAASKMIRDLYPLTDASTLELIPNNIIPDKFGKNGLMKMTRQNLRQLMLNTGNWSNMKKLSEGFGINEADVRRFIDANATAKDVAWVNGVWDIFKMLKPEADAMQLRDTGVPADTIEAVPWDVKGGKLEGGYYPVVYDKYNSDIQGHMAGKNPIFDQHYVPATTPHGYTVARTDYKGALDLEGAFLPSRIQSMIHDIAFREAVRSTNRLISNQEFRTTLAQRWGKEYSDLLPGWLKDIANSHTLDDAYAQGLARGIGLVRQNVISTLIAYNPSTWLKHGFTAALMSAERVGFVELAKATKELGLKDALETAKDLLRRGSGAIPDEDYLQAFRDALDQGERGESLRNFVMQSSAVMRNRARQVDDSIRGAIDKMNELGAMGAFKNLREKNMQYGRFAVAFSDQLSAVPTWYAAYKNAYLNEGMTHADAVFVADKEVSRAHGSTFTGDQPLVTRIGQGVQGEILKMFTPLYKFYNHFANNNFQFVWDANAALHGNPTGEPGANAGRLSRHIAVVLMTLIIEEQASAALDEDKKGFVHSLLMKAAHLFGGQFIGIRDLTSYMTHGGVGPSSGIMGTIVKAGEETVKDIGKSTGLKAGIAKNWIKDTATTIGFATGLGGAQLGRTAQFLTRAAQGREIPKTQQEWRQGLRTGSMKARVH